MFFRTVCIQVWEGLNAVKTGRVMLGETNPAASLPGTIRGDFAIHVSTLLTTFYHHDVETHLTLFDRHEIKSLLNYM